MRCRWSRPSCRRRSPRSAPIASTNTGSVCRRPTPSEVAQGVVWPLLGAESEADEPSPLQVIRDTLREAGVSEIKVWAEVNEPDFCEDCGAPLYPNGKGEIVHTEMPDDVEPEASHFH